MNVRFDGNDLVIEDGRQLNAADLNRAPWVGLLRMALAQEMAWTTPEPVSVTHRPGRAGHPSDHWEAVAGVYLDATKDGVSGIRRIVETWQVPAATARGWKRKCVQRGVLAA